MTTPPPDDATLLRTLATAEGWMVTPSERGFKVRYREECGTLTFTDTDGAWRFVFKMCPAYLTSVDAALALPWPVPSELKVSIRYTTAGVLVDAYLDCPEDSYHAFAWDKPEAHVRCTVFAAWWAATHEEAPHV